MAITFSFTITRDDIKEYLVIWNRPSNNNTINRMETILKEAADNFKYEEFRIDSGTVDSIKDALLSKAMDELNIDYMDVKYFRSIIITSLANNNLELSEENITNIISNIYNEYDVENLEELILDSNTVQDCIDESIKKLFNNI